MFLARNSSVAAAGAAGAPLGAVLAALFHCSVWLGMGRTEGLGQLPGPALGPASTDG